MEKSVIQKWEEEKIDMKRNLFLHVDNFLKLDNEVNRVVLDIMKTVKDNFEKNPSIFNSDDNLRGILSELKSKMDNSKGDDNTIKGGDIYGGGPLQDIIEFIKSISIDLIKEEKEFFLAIIKLIFCDCK